MFDLKSLVKYLLEGLAVAAAAFYIPRKKTALKEVALIALTAAAVFAVLDMFAPSVALGARQGSGFGVGLTMVGGDADEESDSDKLKAVKDLVCDDSSSSDSDSEDSSDSDDSSEDSDEEMTGGNAEEAQPEAESEPKAMQEEGVPVPLEEPVNEPQGVSMCDFSPAPVSN